MFDGLKKTLGRFREDVEEVAEEVEEEGASEEAGEMEEGSTDADPEGGTGLGAEAEASSGAESGPNESVDGSSEQEEGNPEEAAGTIEEDQQSPDDGAGLTQRAKTLARGRVIIDEDDIAGPLEDLELSLLQHDVEIGVAQAILDRVRIELVGESKKFTQRTGGIVEDALREALLSVVNVEGIEFDGVIREADKPVVIIFTGVNGVGKTTSIAKIARYLEDQEYSTVLANGDTFRAGANEQLREHADRLGKKFIAHEQGGDPAAVIYDAVEYAIANDVDVVLGDTAGRLHTNQDLMNQLEKIDRVVDPDITIFVDEAVAGQDAVRRARQFNEAAAIDGTILTKADADTSGGAAISIAHVTKRPILFLGTGQEYTDLERFNPEALVDRLLSE